MHETKKMKVGRPKSSLRWTGKRGRQGVSDIIGTILILAITVTLFSSIFFFVSTLPGPPAQSNSQFSASLGVSPAGHITDVNITYNTGPVLHNDSTAIYLTSVKNSDIYSHGACQLNPYSIWSGVGGHTPGSPDWAAGLTWDLTLANNTGNTCNMAPYNAQEDNITVKIVDTSKNVLLFEVTLPGNVANIPPEFINEGYNPTPVVNTGPFNVWVQVRDDDLNLSSVYANFSNIPNAIPVSGSWHFPSCSCMNFTFNKVSGTWNLYSQIETTTTTGLLGNSFPVTINATDNVSQKNSVVLYVAFTGSQGANIVGALSASPGNPFIGQNTTITATLGNTGPSGGNVLLTFTASSGSFCASQPPLPFVCTQSSSFNVTTTIAAFASGQQVSVFWNAKGPNAMGAGTATITLGVSLPHGVISPLQLTVYPKTLLVDGTGVAQGSLNDPFTYLTTDFISANIPYTQLAALPGSSTISAAACTPFTSTNLACYNIVVWDAGNATGTTACLSGQDAMALGAAMTTYKVSEWLIGADVLSTASCSSASNYLTNFGVSTATPAPSVSPLPLGLNAPASLVLTTIGYPTTGMDLAANAYYTSLNPSTGKPYMTATGGQILAISNVATSSLGFASSFDLATIDTPLSAGAYPVEFASGTGPQAAMAYDVFNWLAGFIGAGPMNANSGTDWAVSQVAVLPISPSFQTTSYVSVTVRDNGVYGSTPIKAILLVNGVPFPTSGSPDQTFLTPAKEGGSAFGTIVWQPDVIGYVTVGVEIFPPSNDSDVANNILYNSLFSVQTYIGYSVLVVDNTQPALANGGPDDTNSTVIPALVAAGFPASTINVTYITHFCGTMPTLPNRYNLVVWNDGSGVNTIGRTSNGKSYCPLTDGNVNLLEKFLMNGGLSASLLFLGPGLMSMTNASTDTTMTGFVSTYLGTTITGTTATGVKSIIGRTTDTVGNGVNIPYTATGLASNYTCTPTGGNGAAFYYNTTGTVIDYWPASTPACAGTEISGTGGWHSAYWAFDLVSTQLSMPLELSTLRATTYFGRLLPGTETVVSPPDITFSQVNRLWTNFTSMHPELDQQYLIDANITNLGASTATSVGLSVYDGSHILASQSLSIAGASQSTSTGQVTLGSSTLSVPWTPLYAGLNVISIHITTSTAGQILPGAATSAKWGFQVYLFYDPTSDNSNHWTHSNQIFWQDPEDPGFNAGITGWNANYLDNGWIIPHWWSNGDPCPSPSKGYQTYPFGQINTGVEWPLAPDGLAPRSGTGMGSAGNGFTQTLGYSSCATAGLYSVRSSGTGYNFNYALSNGYTPQFAGSTLSSVYPSCPGAGSNYIGSYYTDILGHAWNVCPGVWGIDTTGPPTGGSISPFPPCYVSSTLCASLAILDDAASPNYVTWTQSSPITIPSYVSSATASWWQKFTLDPQVTGGVVCVEPATVTSLTLSGASYCTQDSQGSIVSPLPGYTGSVEMGGACTPVNSFTGTSGGGTFTWTQSSMNLTAYAGTTVKIWFGYIEAGGSACGVTEGGYNGGWWINNLQAVDSIPDAGLATWSNAAVSETSASCNVQSGTNMVTQYQGANIPPDLWHLQTVNQSWYTAHGIVAPTQSNPSSVWLGGIPTATNVELDPNLQDGLYSRSIDLTSATSATLSFNYVWEWNGLAGSPPMGFVLEASPVTSNGQTQFIQLWNGDVNATTGAVSLSSNAWQTATVNLNGYLGQVVQLEFFVGTNCMTTYPYVNGGALLTNIQIRGTTAITALPVLGTMGQSVPAAGTTLPSWNLRAPTDGSQATITTSTFEGGAPASGSWLMAATRPHTNLRED